MLLIGMPMLFSWYRAYHRRPLPGHCRCGYNLTGNVSGTCPECGQSVTPAA